MNRRAAKVLVYLSLALTSAARWLLDLAERGYPTRVQLREVTRYEVDGMTLSAPREEYVRALTPSDALWCIRFTQWHAFTEKVQARA